MDSCIQNPDSSLAQLSEEKLEEKRQALIQKIGENIVVRRREIIKSDNLYSYVHGNNKIGSIVSLDQENKNTGEDIAMHIAASSPLVIDPNDLDENLVSKEEEIIKAQVADSDKPENIVEKMVTGRLEKFKSEVSLLNQPFVKDPSKNIKTLLKEQNLNVLNFHRYELGEGIEVNKIDFAEEVKSQLEN